MEVILIAALSADGFIATDNHHLSTKWTSVDDTKRFVAVTKNTGVVIMGANTFRTFNKPLKDRLNVIYSRSKKFEDDFPDNDQIMTTDLSPRDLLKMLKEIGHTKVAICGGTEIYTLFLDSGLVTNILLTIEPVILGNGMPFFRADLTTKIKLHLDHHEVLPTGTVFLDYSVREVIE